MNIRPGQVGGSGAAPVSCHIRPPNTRTATDSPDQVENKLISRTAVLLVVGSLLCTFAGVAWEARGQPGGTTATCGPATEERESAVRGEFTADGKRTQLFLTYDCRVRHEDGPESELLEAPDAASFKTVCRDPVSGRDHAVFFTTAGASSSTVQVWGVDPATAALKPLYTEWWGDMEPGDDRWGLDRLVAGEGTCLWRDRREARDTVKAAMMALRVRAGGDVGPGGAAPDTLPARGIPAGTARKWLKALEGARSAVILEGAVYADDAGRASWRVVQALGTTLREREGRSCCSTGGRAYGGAFTT